MQVLNVAKPTLAERTRNLITKTGAVTPAELAQWIADPPVPRMRRGPRQSQVFQR